MKEKKVGRMDKVEREIKALLSTYFVRELSFYSEALISLATVKVMKDLRNANVYISVLGDAQEAAEALKLVESLRADMQSYLATNLRIKYIPRLQFFLDDTFAENFRIMQKLKDLGFNQPVDLAEKAP